MNKMEKIKTNLKKIIESTERDRVMVYAAQASYFVLMSVIPFICLLISVVSFFIPTDIYTIFEAYPMPDEMEKILFIVIDQLLATQKVSLLSISAIIALWTASRGADAVLVGLGNVYHEEVPKGIVKDIVKQQLKSLASTVILIIVLFANVIFSMFGATIAEILHLTTLYNIIMYFSIPIMFIIMCVAFTIIYSFVGKVGKVCWKDRIMQHLPGAVFTTMGWLVFSYGYALYLRFFPSASAIYGSLTAVCLIMLWLYICIVILLLGAELNKLIMRNKGIIVKNEKVKTQA